MNLSYPITCNPQARRLREFGVVGTQGNVIRLSRWRVPAVQFIEQMNSMVGYVPGGGMIRSAIRGTRDPSYSNTPLGIASSIASVSPLFMRGKKASNAVSRGFDAIHTKEAASSFANESTPNAVGFDEVLFNTLTTLDYGDGKLFVDAGKTIGGAQIELRSDIANSGSLEGSTKLANSFIGATSTILQAIASGQNVDFSSKAGRQKVMEEFENNREIYERFISITAANNLVKNKEEEKDR